MSTAAAAGCNVSVHAAAGPASRAAVAGPAASFACGIILLELHLRNVVRSLTLELAHLLTVCTADGSLSSLGHRVLFVVCICAQLQEHAGAMKKCEIREWPSDEVSDFTVV